MHYFDFAYQRSLAIRDSHLKSIPKSQRPALEASYASLIARLLERKKLMTAAYRKAIEGGHGFPRTLKESQLIELIEPWLLAGELGDWTTAEQAFTALERSTL